MTDLNTAFAEQIAKLEPGKPQKLFYMLYPSTKTRMLNMTSNSDGFMMSPPIEIKMLSCEVSDLPALAEKYVVEGPNNRSIPRLFPKD